MGDIHRLSATRSAQRLEMAWPSRLVKARTQDRFTGAYGWNLLRLCRGR